MIILILVLMLLGGISIRIIGELDLCGYFVLALSIAVLIVDFF